MNIWLDDERPAPEGWIWVKDAWDALILVRDGNVEKMSLDHDLGNEPWTGYWLLCQIENDLHDEQWQYDLPEIYIHSWNPVGRKNMQRALAAIQRTRIERGSRSQIIGE